MVNLADTAVVDIEREVEVEAVDSNTGIGTADFDTQRPEEDEGQKDSESAA